jgi:hypothetical protein
MTISRELLKKLRSDIDAALVQVGKANGVSIKTGNARFDDATATFKLNVASLMSDGTVVDTARRDYQQYAEVYGLKPEWLDQTFSTMSDGTYKIIGLLPNRRKKPVSVANIRTGKKYIMTVDSVVRSMNTQAPKNGTAVNLPAKNPNHDRIVMLINDMKSNGPENYYGDGEFKASGMTEKQIYDMHYNRFARTLAGK